MTFDDKYFDSYAKSLLELPIEEFKVSLPSESQSGYLEFINKLLSYINNEINANLEIRGSSTDSSDIEYLDSEIDKLQKMKSIIERKIGSITEDLPVPNFDIIFLKSNAGNPFIFKDLKSIPEEYYNTLIDLINELKQHDFSTGNITTKIKNMGNEKRFENVLEFITFKLRLYFRVINENTILLLQASFKTQTHSKLIKETLESRNILASKSIDKLKRDLSDDEERISIMEENAKIEEEMFEYLKQNKRGNK